MTYAELINIAAQHGFTRIERDDRLLDIFPAENREKGVELWEKWTSLTTHLLKIRLPYQEKNLKLYNFPRIDIEKSLQTYEERLLDEELPTATGKEVVLKMKE